MHPPDSQLRRHQQFHSAFLEQDRDVLVWLPPGYDHPTDVSRPFDGGPAAGRYPVLYMHDGQNLFEPETAYNKGEHWRVGETAARLIAQGRIEPLIVVGIYNTGEMRIEEYTPTEDKKLGGGHADDYGRMIIEELKPLIDRTYRTRQDRDSTGIAGSSLGGLVSLHLGFTHPAVFGKVAALSPSVWWGRKAILKTAHLGRHGHRRRAARAGRRAAAEGGAGGTGIQRRRAALRGVRRRDALGTGLVRESGTDA
jgi:enterochelin esterase-like enzyme